MFIQLIEGRTSNPEALRKQADRWLQELGSGAIGYLGSTLGVTDDGTAVLLARFESEDAARANSERPEQGEWWSETEQYFDEPPTFRDFTEVDTTLAGGSDDAGFVQIMQGRATDKERLRAMEAELTPQMQQVRPDVIGSIRLWDGNDFTDVIYFTSEAEAREGEKKMTEGEPPDGMDEYMGLFDGEIRYLDLRDPWLRTP